MPQSPLIRITQSSPKSPDYRLSAATQVKTIHQPLSQSIFPLKSWLNASQPTTVDVFIQTARFEARAFLPEPRILRFLDCREKSTPAFPQYLISRRHLDREKLIHIWPTMT